MPTPRATSGFTLLEMVTTFSLISILMAIVTVWIGQSLKFSATLKHHQQQHQQLTRLARHFRDDVHNSQSMSVEDGRRLILQQHAGNKIAYSISGTRIDVEKQTGDHIVRESFRLSPHSHPFWDTSSLPQTIGLVVSRPLTPQPIETHHASTDLDLTSDSETRRSRISDALSAHDIGSDSVELHVFVSLKRYPSH